MQGLVVFGRTGQVGCELARLAPDATFLDRNDADLRDPTACELAIKEARVVINTAAYTAVDRAEAEPALAYAINADAPAAMAKACKANNIPFIHISSDYVLDGTGDTARNESTKPAPKNVYGTSKLAGEQAVMELGGQWAILRTSWVFSANGSNFVKTMLRLGRQHSEIKVVVDQFGGPTPARDIANALLVMAEVMQKDPSAGGIYHFAGYPDVSWADFAATALQMSGLDCQITPITTAEYPTPAVRPLNSRLDCRLIETAFGIARPDWRQSLTQIITQLDQS
ncbi:dTDP-4-dehydrorhamnose reductase [Paracoccus sp. JM45]|uniref:dTDP-4-dehydrorhamnose reductase n=1 Tax=Paracoccus sp. JM45 TaxID=2283626 RepID=UPI000E6BCF24|nr:dTDP-4-dehydrorhamnose reductase [Paracoccus sp. JM45]RJE79092.1 dTDP-4-dehydrorhamnose reductase [Paracoccus sp. JM45]